MSIAWIRDLKAGSSRRASPPAVLAAACRTLKEPAVMLRGDDVLDVNAELRTLLGLGETDTLDEMRWSELLEQPWPLELGTLRLGDAAPDPRAARLRSAGGPIPVRLIEVAAAADCRVLLVDRYLEASAPVLLRELPDLVLALSACAPGDANSSLGAAARALGAEVAWLGCVHQVGRNYRVERCWSGSGSWFSPGQDLELGDLPCSMIVEADTAVAIHHLSAQASPAQRPYARFGFESYIGAPLSVDGQLYGTLAFASRTPKASPWSETQVQFVRALSGALGRSLEAQRILAELREARVRVEALSRLDPVSGILNRRSIIEVAGREVLRSRRYHGALSVLQIRIEGFTDVNRELGAAHADEILRGLARVLAQTLREVDSVGRFGSATFLAVLPSTDEAGANVAIERIRSKITTIQALPAALSLSYGLRTVRSTDTLDEVLVELDRATDASTPLRAGGSAPRSRSGA